MSLNFNYDTIFESLFDNESAVDILDRLVRVTSDPDDLYISMTGFFDTQLYNQLTVAATTPSNMQA